MVDVQYLIFVRSLLAMGENIQMKFMGSSMLPTIPTDCTILLSKVWELMIGEIYVYISPEPHESLVCHRLVDRQKEYFLFCGDNRHYLDQAISKDRIIGKCIGYIQNGNVVFLQGSRVKESTNPAQSETSCSNASLQTNCFERVIE